MNDTIWIHYARPRSTWYELDDNARKLLQDRWAAIDAQAATTADPLGRYFVRGQSDYSTVEIWKFPSYDAAYDHWAAKVSAGYAEWFDFDNNVGNRPPS